MTCLLTKSSERAISVCNGARKALPGSVETSGFHFDGLAIRQAPCKFLGCPQGRVSLWETVRFNNKKKEEGERWKNMEKVDGRWASFCWR